jgi:hypothetical protein
MSVVGVVVNMNQATLAKLKEQAEAEGKAIGDFVGELLACIVDDASDGGFVLSAEQEQQLIDADAAIERGEYFTLEQMRAAMKASRER